jgi:hypothetical protein
MEDGEMVGENGKVRLFIAVSYGPACGIKGRASVRYRARLEELAILFENHGASVYLSPRDESWGLARPKQDIAIKRDMSALLLANGFILDLGGFDSDGAMVELGAAIALRKPVWVIQEERRSLPSYVEGVCAAGYGMRVLLGGYNDGIDSAVAMILRQITNHAMPRSEEESQDIGKVK